MPEAPPIRLDVGVRVWRDGEVLVGGSPWRMLRLAPAAQAVLATANWASPVGRQLARRLIAAGMAHPEPAAPADCAPLEELSVVVPVRDRPAALRRLLDALDPRLEVVVVDDGSRQPLSAAATRHEQPQGPAAARNAGLALARGGLVAFLDSDCLPPDGAGWLRLLAHFDDPAVAAVAPRIAVDPCAAPSWLARYEQARSPLDLGDAPSLVRPGARVSYLPAAALLVRRSALDSLHRPAFDPRLRYGEDVDLVWRLIDAGWQVRYEPSVTVRHACRDNLGSWLRQRFGYGSSAGALARRHPPGRLAPLVLNRWTAAQLVLLVSGQPVAAGGVGLYAASRLADRLPVARPTPMAARLVARGALASAEQLLRALIRPYAPLTAIAWWAARHTSQRRRVSASLAAAILAPAALDAARRRPRLDPLRWLVLHRLDDLAHTAGVWAGCARYRSIDPLRPRERVSERPDGGRPTRNRKSQGGQRGCSPGRSSDARLDIHLVGH